jgi:peptidoglycan/xylan/chitin deacetylase (PgdA/CDA1 family)
MDTSTELANGLDRDIAALKAKAADYGARHRVIEKCTWPQGARIAVNFTADFDAMLLRRVLNEPPMQLAKGAFGRICELYPQAVKAASKSGHEIADHMWEHQVPKDPALEREHLRRAKDAIEKLTGHRPVGTRSWHTRQLLLDEGYIYNSHDTPDHRPHYISEPDGSKALLNLPFHYAIDDAMFFSFAWLNTENDAQRMMDPEHVEEIWWAAFLQQYQQGGYLNICMHPFVSGRALRIAMLDRLIERMKRLPGVWFPTCEQVARHVLSVHPAS